MTDRDEYQDVMQKLGVLAPGEEDAPEAPNIAWAQLQAHLDANQASPLIQLRRYFTMSNRKVALSALAAIVILAVAFSLAPVRAAASDFLGLFRVQKFAAISVSPQQVALLERVADQGLYPGEFEFVDEPVEPQKVATLEEAESLSGGHVYQAASLGAPTEIQVSGQGRARLVVDLDSARGILRAAELDPQLLPDSLDGAEIDVTVYPVVHQSWGDDLTFMQSSSPLIDYPDDVDANVLGEALLQMLGMSQGEARRLASSIDWSSTLLLPVPENVATFSEVEVNGTSALALTSLEGGESSLIWQQDGTVFMLGGSQTVEELQEVAASIE